MLASEMGIWHEQWLQKIGVKVLPINLVTKNQHNTTTE